MASVSSDQFDWDIHTWKTLDSYFSQDKVLTEHQTKSFDDFIDFVIPQIIERNNPLTIATEYDEEIKDFKKKFVIEFMQTYMSKPLIQENNDVIKPLYPNEARLRGLTYSGPMFIDVKCTYTERDRKGPSTIKEIVENKIPFAKIPIMLGSKYDYTSEKRPATVAEMGECPFDQGGYFIVNGGEKVLIAQERVAENQVYVWTPSKSSTSKYTHEAEIKSSADQRFYPVKTNKVKLSKEPSERQRAMAKDSVPGRRLYVQMPYMKEDIPLFIMFRALGVISEREIYEMILSNIETASSNYINLLLPSVEETRMKGVMTQDAALSYISKHLNLAFRDEFKEKKTKYVKDILNRELLPHIGQNNRKKAMYLAYMTRRLLDCYFGVRPYDDRDHYGNKRVDLAGPLLTQLFRANFIKLTKELTKDVRQRILPDPSRMSGGYPSLRKIIQSCSIESKIKYGLATGNWATQKSALSSSKVGIAQVLNRLSYIGALIPSGKSR